MDTASWGKGPGWVLQLLSLDDQLLHAKCGFILFVGAEVSREVQHSLLSLSEAESGVVVEGELWVDGKALAFIFSAVRRAELTDFLVAIFGENG